LQQGIAMTKTYQIKINQGKASTALDIPQAGPKGQAVTVKATAGTRYQLIDPETQYAPENIRASRQGKDLKVSFEGSNTTDLVIEDYYKVSPEGYNGLIGEAETGRFYEYIPENASGMASVPLLADSGMPVGMALGGAEVAPAGAAVGILAAGLFSPVWLGAGALGVAAAAGGAAGTKDTTPPTGQTGALAAASDSGAKDNVTSVTKPTIEGVAEANSKVSVTLKDENGKLTGPYTATADASGKYSIAVTDALVDSSSDTKGTQYTPIITVTDASNNSSKVMGTPFIVDTTAPNLTLAIHADINNNGVISYIENGNSTVSKNLNVTASFDKTKANVGDEVHFQLSGGADQKVPLTQAMVDAGKAVFSFVGGIVDSTLLKVSAWFVDTAHNQSVTATDEAQVDLSVAVHVISIAGDDMINAVESSKPITVNGTATASGTVWLKVGTVVVGSATVATDGTWSTEVLTSAIKDGTSLNAELKLASGGAVLATDPSHTYSLDSSAKASTVDVTLTALENLAYKTSSAEIWVPLLKGATLTDSGAYSLSDASGNLYKPPSTNATDSSVEYSPLNTSHTSVNSSDLTVSQLLLKSDELHIDYASLAQKNINPAVKSVNLADGAANIMSIDSLDVLNHGVLNVLGAGLGQNPQFKVFGDASGDILKLSNLLGGKGVWTEAETVNLVGDAHTYTHYSAYALGLEVDLLVDKNITVSIV